MTTQCFDLQCVYRCNISSNEDKPAAGNNDKVPFAVGGTAQFDFEGLSISIFEDSKAGREDLLLYMDLGSNMESSRILRYKSANSSHIGYQIKVYGSFDDHDHECKERISILFRDSISQEDRASIQQLLDRVQVIQQSRRIADKACRRALMDAIESFVLSLCHFLVFVLMAGWHLLTMLYSIIISYGMHTSNS